MQRDDDEVTADASPGPLLHVDDLKAAYKGVPALSGVSLSVPPGALVVVVGASGSGKTTLLRAVSGLLALHGGRVTGGRIALSGQSPAGVALTQSLVGLPAAKVVRLGVACVLEGRRVFRDLTVEENLRAGAFTIRSRAHVRAAVEGVLDRFPLLASRRATQAGYLSGGEQQLLVLGRALVAAPRLLLLDEPALGLAPVAVDAVAEVIAGVALDGAGVVLAERRAAGYGEAGVMARACGATVMALERQAPVAAAAT